MRQIGKDLWEITLNATDPDDVEFVAYRVRYSVSMTKIEGSYENPFEEFDFRASREILFGMVKQFWGEACLEENLRHDVWAARENYESAFGRRAYREMPPANDEDPGEPEHGTMVEVPDSPKRPYRISKDRLEIVGPGFLQPYVVEGMKDEAIEVTIDRLNDAYEDGFHAVGRMALREFFRRVMS